MIKAKRWDFWTWITIAIGLIFVLFLLYPLLSLFVSGFRNPENQKLSLINFQKFFTRKYYYRTLLHSSLVTVCTTVLAVSIGAPLAYLTCAFKVKGKGLIDILIIISMLSPPFIGAYSWVLLCGRSGLITKLLSSLFGFQMPSIYGFGGIVLVLTLKLFPYIYLYTAGALKKVDSSLSEAAESLGCSPFKKVVTIILPLIMPTVLAGALLVFMNALADFGTPMLIGEGYMVMPVLVYNEFVSETGGQANFAAAIAVILVLITAGLFVGQKYVVNKRSFTMSSLRPFQAAQVKGGRNVVLHAVVYAIVFFAIIPQLTVVYTSFRKTSGSIFAPGYSLQSYQDIIRTLGSAVRNTYLFGLIAIVIVIILAIFIAYVTTRRPSWLTAAIDTMTMFPYIIPGSVLGITLLLAFNKKPLLLSGTACIIIVAFVVRRLPYTLRSSAAILYQLSPSLEEAAISLGDSPVRSFFKVTSRMMMPGVLSGAILSWITIINELSASVLLYTGRTRTMSVSIYTEVIRGNYGTAAALSSVLTLTTIVSLLLFFKASGSRDISI